MKYGRVIETAFGATFKAWGEWAFVLSVWAAGLPVIVVVSAGYVASAIAYASSRHLTAPVVLGFVVSTLVAIVSFWFLGLILHGGLVHLTNEWQEGRPATAADGWRGARRVFGRILLFELLYGLAANLVFFVVLAVFGGAAVSLVLMATGGSLASLGSGDAAWTALAAFSVPLCCLYLALVVLMSLAGALMSAFESVGVREVVVAGIDAQAALRSAWHGLMSRKKEFFLMGLIAVGLAQAFQTVTSVLAQPVQFASQLLTASSGQGPDVAVAIGVLFLMFVLILIMMGVQIPWMVFLYQLWTAFYRQLTGRYVPPESVYAQRVASGEDALPPPPVVPAGD